tara:strand:- start:261 stop:725 length:465 start_codon:yes stop_codon:yes gene_type:complete
MAYKIRDFLSLEEALSYAIEQLGDEIIEKATEKSSSYIRKCSDPDSPQILPYQLAMKIDLECLKLNKGTPLFSFYQHQLIMSMKDVNIEERLNDVVGQMSAKALLIVDRVIQAMNKFDTNEGKISKADLKEISEAIKQMEEKILKVKVKVEEHI